jgi:hypothetical protein
MTFRLSAILIASIILVGCANDTASIRLIQSEGPLKPNTVPEFYKVGVADQVQRLQGGNPKVLELRIGAPSKALIGTASSVEVAVKTAAVISIGDPPTRCYIADFINQSPTTGGLRPAQLDGCSDGMEDMLAFYKSRYPT